MGVIKMKSKDAIDILNRVIDKIKDLDEISQGMDGVMSLLSKRLEMHGKGVPVFAPRIKCKYAEVTDTKYIGEGKCGGYIVNCKCEENPVKESYECACNKRTCNFFEKEDKNK
jgi:hypothetical protein